ncbi:hypothetical protein [Bdellovibrio bacteriovorus]|uniref:Lipoprotein n=1 Tax=Bdellovibrio bacteriovorus str. Tiberius TaxID=1069642 RepID=K7YW61_BDEBC|nr:hypothetical protein [Bdellovibrio bacteriovorus]AFY01903.1 Hypothetical protein Bdt_2219 [Bdellovibrio bacteriovorus str. Tiberius]
MFIQRLLLITALITSMGATSLGASLCSSIFATSSAKTGLHSSQSQWEQLFQGAQTPQQYKTAIQQMIRTMEQSPLGPPAQWRTLNQNYQTEFLFLMPQINFVEPLIKMRSSLTTAQKKDLLESIDGFKSAIQESNRVSLHYWHLQFETMKMALSPKLADAYIKNIPADTALIQNTNHYLTISLQRVLETLPTKDAARLTTMLTKGIQKEYKNKDPEMKDRRRNFEALHRIINSATVSKYYSALQGKSSLSKAEASRIVEQFWNEFYQTPTQKRWRSEYSFSLVLKTAAALPQSPLAKHLSPDSVLEIYGSFPNGKADLQKSDFDLHLSRDLARKFIQSFTDRNRNYAEPFADQFRDQPTGEARSAILEFSNDLVATEKRVSEIMGITRYEPSELMTIVPLLDSSFHTPAKINYYNPISLRLEKGRMYLEFHDVIKQRQALKIELTDGPSH